jgi:hypothetical protein
LNNGDGTFSDESADVSDTYDSRACTWGDFNGDGRIDLYVVNGEDSPGSGTAAHDRLYLNNGGSSFTDSTAASGIDATTARVGAAVSCCDFNGDHYLDIFVANDLLGPNFLWENNGSGVFTNVAPDIGLEGEDEGAGQYGSSSGVSWGTFDNDLDFDLLVTNRKSSPPQPYEDNSHFYVNFNEDDLYDWYDISWISADGGARCPAWFDYNNDTQMDFYLCTEDGLGALYNGHGSGAFLNVAGFAGLGVSKPLGCALADYDNDGGLDIFICAADRVYLFRNTHDQYNWLRVKLTGSLANAAAIGSVVMVTCPCTTPDTILRQIGGSNGTGCQDSLVAHFGMGKHGGPYTIDVLWSSYTGTTTQQVTGAAINQLHEVTQP